MLRTARPLLFRLARQQASPLTKPFLTSPRQTLPAVPRQWNLAPRKNSYATKTTPDDPKTDHEKRIANLKLEAHPDLVTSRSSTRELFDESDNDRTAQANASSVTDELRIVKETLALSSVPKEPYILGLAGTLPYLGTSLSTMFLAWNLNSPSPEYPSLAYSLHLSEASAQQLLNLLEPVQLGYGALLLSFLGAIHWGLELGATTPNAARKRARYALGIVPTLVAWPTLLMPIHFALTAQFATFVGLYLADARAAARGWAPTWYPTYRFVLTLIVGVSIMLSLVGRAKIGEANAGMSAADIQSRMTEPGLATVINDPDWDKMEEEEKERRHQEQEAKRKEEEQKKKAEAEKKKKAEKKSDKEDDKSSKAEDKNKEPKSPDAKPKEAPKRDTDHEKKNNQEGKQEGQSDSPDKSEVDVMRKAAHPGPKDVEEIKMKGKKNTEKNSD